MHVQITESNLFSLQYKINVSDLFKKKKSNKNWLLTEKKWSTYNNQIILGIDHTLGMLLKCGYKIPIKIHFLS